MTMDTDPNAKNLFCSALELTPKEREGFLLKACQGNSALYQEVWSLLASYEQAESFLEQPAANFAAQLILQEKDGFGLTNQNRFLEQIIGQTLDNKYLIEKQLGQGGMGAVYKAIHIGTDRPVAVKVITPQFMANSEFVERFRREAKATGKLSHPNVVNVTDFGVTDFGSTSVAYLVMEYLKGLTLGELLKQKGKLSVSFTIDMLEQICAAVNEAHLQGIIHRDLKPDNIWLELDGRGSYHVKVLDFGLAKLYSNNLLEKAPLTNSLEITKGETTNTINTLLINGNISKPTLAIEPIFNEKDTRFLPVTKTAKNNIDAVTAENMTRAGTILGTPLYMSPEQCQGIQVDAKSDIYSLAVIAYEMLNGEPPFRGEFKQLVGKHLTATPEPLYTKHKNIPKAISELIMIGLAKNPLERFPSVKAFAIALRTNFEQEKPFINQAYTIYQKHLRPIINISFIISLVFTLFSGLLSTIIIENYFHPFNSNFLEGFWWFLPILCLFILGEISKGAFALAVKESQETNKILTKQVLIKLAKHIPSILTTTLHSYLLSVLQLWKFIFPTLRTYIYYSLSAPIIILEEKKGVQVMKRSKDLLTQFYSLAFSLEIRSLFIKTIAFILFLVSFLISISFSDAEMGFLPRLVVTTFCTLLLPGLFMTFASPITDIAVNLLYLKSREAKGETPYQRSLSVEGDLITEGIKFSGKRKVCTALALIGSIVVASFSYIVIVPPSGKPIEVVRPKFEKIPDAENAWVEYDLAIQSLTPVSMRLGNTYNTNHSDKNSYYSLIADNTIGLTKAPGFKNLEKAANGQMNFNDQQLALLDQHQKALEHLLLAIKRPKAQYYIEAPNSSFTPPSLIQNRALITIACAQAQRLHLAGKTSEAIELALAAYRMGTDLARDPNAMLIQALTSVINRQIARNTLFSIINSGTTDAKTDLEIARRISELDSLMPNAYHSYNQETQAILASLEDAFIKKDLSQSGMLGDLFPYNNDFRKTFINSLSGLRIRSYNAYVKFIQSYSEKVRPSAENWDFPTARDVHSKSSELSGSLSPIDTLAYYSFSVSHPYVLGVMKTFYLDRSVGATLTSFAAISAYKKAHGEFPANLEVAIAEAKLPMPIDLATKKVPGYRLENGNPIVWFAGIDGKDDNGQKAYEVPKNAVAEDGKDLIFVYGKMWLID